MLFVGVDKFDGISLLSSEIESEIGIESLCEMEETESRQKTSVAARWRYITNRQQTKGVVVLPATNGLP